MSDETTETLTTELPPEPAPEPVEAPATAQPPQAGPEEPDPDQPSAGEGVDQPPAQPAGVEPEEVEAVVVEEPPDHTEAIDALKAEVQALKVQAIKSEWKAIHARLRTEDGYESTVEAVFAGKDPRDPATRDAIDRFAVSQARLFKAAAPPVQDRPSIKVEDFVTDAAGNRKAGAWVIDEANIRRTLGLH